MRSVGDPLHHDLDVAECLRLLGTAAIGRLGFSQAALPVVQPVTYRLANGAVLITAIRGRTASALQNGIVVLDVDSFGMDPTEGWAVNVVGPIRLAEGSLLLEPVLVSGWRRTACLGPGPAA